MTVSPTCDDGSELSFELWKGGWPGLTFVPDVRDFVACSIITIIIIIIITRKL